MKHITAREFLDRFHKFTEELMKHYSLEECGIVCIAADDDGANTLCATNLSQEDLVTLLERGLKHEKAGELTEFAPTATPDKKTN